MQKCIPNLTTEENKSSRDLLNILILAKHFKGQFMKCKIFDLAKII